MPDCRSRRQLAVARFHLRCRHRPPCGVDRCRVLPRPGSMPSRWLCRRRRGGEGIGVPAPDDSSPMRRRTSRAPRWCGRSSHECPRRRSSSHHRAHRPSRSCFRVAGRYRRILIGTRSGRRRSSLPTIRSRTSRFGAHSVAPNLDTNLPYRPRTPVHPLVDPTATGQ